MESVLFASLLLQWILFDLVAAPGVFFRCGGALPDANNAALPYSIQAVGDLLRLITAQNFRDLAGDFHVTLPEKFLYE